MYIIWLSRYNITNLLSVQFYLNVCERLVYYIHTIFQNSIESYNMKINTVITNFGTLFFKCKFVSVKVRYTLKLFKTNYLTTISYLNVTVEWVWVTVIHVQGIRHFDFRFRTSRLNFPNRIVRSECWPLATRVLFIRRQTKFGQWSRLDMIFSYRKGLLKVW